MLPGMAFVASVSRRIAAPPEVAFDRLADHRSWERWMPPSFRPVGQSPGPLAERRRFRVKIRGAPFPVSLSMSVVRRPKELCWCGGVRGVLYAEHRFSFSSADAVSVEVRSEERWSGLLAGLLRAAIEPRAEQVGRDQLSALAAAAELPPRT